MSAHLQFLGKKSLERNTVLWSAGVVGIVAAWLVVNAQLVPFADWAVSRFPLVPGRHVYMAGGFFIYDTPKVLLLTLVVFAILHDERDRRSLPDGGGHGQRRSGSAWHRHRRQGRA